MANGPVFGFDSNTYSSLIEATEAIDLMDPMWCLVEFRASIRAVDPMKVPWNELSYILGWNLPGEVPSIFAIFLVLSLRFSMAS